MKYIYGPVHSRRLGFSLGISSVPYKVCNFDCIYCQLGNTTIKKTQRKEYLRIKDILSELRQFVSEPDFKGRHIDYITLSGAGEPLLNSGISALISGIKKLVPIPVALITNASLLISKDIRQEVLGVDLILPSLDAITKETFEKIDRPCKGINIEDIIDGLINLRREFSGKIYLEIMIVKGMNDNLDEFVKIREVVLRINPDKVHLNVPKRHTSENGVHLPEEKTLKKIKEILGQKCEII